MPNRLLIRRAAVLGAGVMGAQIAAHLVNANIEVVLFDIPSSTGDKSERATKGMQGLVKMDPAPLSSPERISSICPANYDDHLPFLKECDLVIEAVAEDMNIKLGLFNRLLPVLKDGVIFATNTSGLSVNKLAQSLPQQHRKNFLGVHFFNPPRYMELVELIPAQETSPELMDAFETLVVSRLGKSVVRAKDTPNFVANRIGVFAVMSTLHHANRLNIPFEVVDALTGPYIGRPRSATFRTMDLVGIDVMGHVVKNMYDMLPEDPWRSLFESPKWMGDLCSKGATGKKSGQGIYKKQGSDFLVYDPSLGDYRPSTGQIDPEVETILKNQNQAERFSQLLKCQHPQARFLISIFGDLFQYSAYFAADIAHSVADVDKAMRWGFGWEAGPFEIWSGGGWKNLGMWLQGEIAAGRTTKPAKLPAWVSDGKIESLYTRDSSFSPATNNFVKESSLPVYQRHVPPLRRGQKFTRGTTIFENEGVRCWHDGDGIAVLSFNTKMHTVDENVLKGIMRAVDEAEKGYKGLVLWQTEPPFSAGANLQLILGYVSSNNVNGAREAVKMIQQASMRLKYSHVPTVAAVSNLVLGGGCELMMHTTRVVAALETYSGLVEAGVGLIPAGAGTKELAIRCAQASKDPNPFSTIRYAFETVAMAKVSKSAEDARQLGFLRQSDVVIFHPNELLAVAKAQVEQLANSNYCPPLPAREVRVAGRFGLGNIKAQLLNMMEGKFISQHDRRIAEGLGFILCGGDVDPGTAVSEDYLLKLEEDVFVDLLATKETQARIEHMLKTGKPLRN